MISFNGSHAGEADGYPLEPCTVSFDLDCRDLCLCCMVFPEILEVYNRYPVAFECILHHLQAAVNFDDALRQSVNASMEATATLLGIDTLFSYRFDQNIHFSFEVAYIPREIGVGQLGVHGFHISSLQRQRYHTGTSFP